MLCALDKTLLSVLELGSLSALGFGWVAELTIGHSTRPRGAATTH